MAPQTFTVIVSITILIQTTKYAVATDAIQYIGKHRTVLNLTLTALNDVDVTNKRAWVEYKYVLLNENRQTRKDLSDVTIQVGILESQHLFTDCWVRYNSDDNNNNNTNFGGYSLQILEELQERLHFE